MDKMDSEHPSLSQLIAIHMMHINSNSSGTCIGLMLGMHLCFGDGSKLGTEPMYLVKFQVKHAVVFDATNEAQNQMRSL